MIFDTSTLIALTVGIFSMFSYIATLIYRVGSKLTYFELRLSHIEKNQQTIIKDIEKIENRVYK